MRAENDTSLVERVRTAAREAVALQGLRPVARDTGLSPSGLQKFLDGSTPYAPTWVKLQRWYSSGALSPEEIRAEAALSLLVDGLPRERKPVIRTRLLQFLREAYRVSGVAAPSWLTSLEH